MRSGVWRLTTTLAGVEGQRKIAGTISLRNKASGEIIAAVPFAAETIE